jgi:hypothetical protein
MAPRVRTEILPKCDRTPVTPRGHHPSFTGNSVMSETQQSAGAGQNVSVSSAGVWEEGQIRPPKTKQAGVRPHEMDKVDIAVFGRIIQVNGDT